jgi:hypothetical protein
MAGKRDDPYMEWMDDAEYLAYADSVNGVAPPREPPAPAGPAIEATAPLEARCRACAKLVAESREPPVGDVAGRWWHRECARQALGKAAPDGTRGRCPGCGAEPPEKGYLFDGGRKWHVDGRCAGRVLGTL